MGIQARHPVASVFMARYDPGTEASMILALDTSLHRVCLLQKYSAKHHTGIARDCIAHLD